MLFSRDDVCKRINTDFEPTWVSLRPVPILRIDFGNGRVLTRTLHGNILTSVCDADGHLLDCLPGIYTPEAYLKCLAQLRGLAADFARQPAGRRADWLREYHQKAVAALDAQQLAAFRLDVGKGRIERPTRQLLAAGTRSAGLDGLPPNGSFPLGKWSQPAAKGPPPPAGWKELVEDTRLNETARRRAIHGLLAGAGLVAPDKVIKPVYRDVLHADLDDPYLGLGKALFAHYPFAAEDAAPAGG